MALEIEKKAQQATINYLNQNEQVKVRVVHEKETVYKAVKEAENSGDLSHLRDLYDQYRVRPQAPPGSPTPGESGSHPEN